MRNIRAIRVVCPLKCIVVEQNTTHSKCPTTAAPTSRGCRPTRRTRCGCARARGTARRPPTRRACSCAPTRRRRRCAPAASRPTRSGCCGRRLLLTDCISELCFFFILVVEHSLHFLNLKLKFQDVTAALFMSMVLGQNLHLAITDVFIGHCFRN